MWDALVKCLNTETAKMKDWVIILYSLNIFIVSFCTNSKDTNLYVRSIWWNAAKLVYLAGRLFPFLGEKWGGVDRGHCGGTILMGSVVGFWEVLRMGI